MVVWERLDLCCHSSAGGVRSPSLEVFKNCVNVALRDVVFMMAIA